MHHSKIGHSTSGLGQNENPPFLSLCQLPSAADVPPHEAMCERCQWTKHRSKEHPHSITSSASCQKRPYHRVGSDGGYVEAERMVAPVNPLGLFDPGSLTLGIEKAIYMFYSSSAQGARPERLGTWGAAGR